MGLIDFIKDAGKKVFGGDDEKTGGTTTADPDEQFNELRKGNVLTQMVRKLGLEAEDLRVTFDDGIATVTGSVVDQSTKEKIVLVIGNSQGVARVDDRLEVERPEPEATLYTVESGDTLSAIAKRHYGDASKYPQIFEANRPMLEDPDRIYPGQVLRIPRL